MRGRGLFVGRPAMANMIFVTILTLLISGTFYLREQVLNRARSRVTRTYEVKGHIHTISEKIKNMEVGQYGYLITDDTAFLEPSTKELRQDASENDDGDGVVKNHSLFDEFRTLRGLTADNPAQRRNLDQLEQLILQRLDYSDSTTRLRKTLGLNAASVEIGSRRGLSLTLDIDAIIAGMLAEEDRLFRERLLTEKKHLRLNQILMYSAVLVFFVGLIAELSLAIAYKSRRREMEMALQEHNILLHAIMDGGKHAIFSTDSTGTITSFNRAAERMLGYPASHFVGRKAGEMMEQVYEQEELRTRAQELSVKFGRPITGIEIFLLPLEGQGIYEQEWTVCRNDGKRVPITLTVTALRTQGGEIHGFLGIAQDISDRKEIDRVKNEFISTVSHELRTPLTSIRGALGLVSGGAAGQLPEKASELVAIAHKNSERLVLIINDILDIKKIESGKLSLHIVPVGVADVVQQALEANQIYGDKYSVTFISKRVDASARVMADSSRLMQIMANLLSNAAKFSPAGSEVWVNADCRDGRVHFSIRDFGAGISEEFRARIFQKFAQADQSGTRHFEGTGLGLSIAKRLVEAMGGTIRFETTLKNGTTFFFDLPQAHVVSSASASTFHDGVEKQRILICEDDRDVAALLKVWLERAGFAVEMTHTLAETREKLRSKSFSAMTLDLMLPDGSGLDFVHELRVNPITHGMPIVVVSMSAEEGERASGDVIGIVDWLTKPVDEGQLVEALKQAVSGIGEARPHILHVEDNVDLAHIIGRSLQGIVDLTIASTLREAEKWLKVRRFDLVVLDLTLPDGSGLDLLERLNSLAGYPVPVLILSAHETDKTVQSKVKAALVKSRVSEARIVETILAMVQGQNPQVEEMV